MKKYILILLIFLLFLFLVVLFIGLNNDGLNNSNTFSHAQGNSPLSPLEYAYQDVQWGFNVQKNMKILKSDFDNVSIATNKSDYNSLAVAAQYEIDHTQKAIEENDQYKVSSKLQGPQTEWRAALQDYNSAGNFLQEGANEVKRGRSGFDNFQKATSLSNSGTAHLKKASEALGINVPIK